MKTKKQVISEYPQYKKLINAVLNNIDEDQIDDINKHGINCGFGNFIYYHDTCAFYKKYKKEIIKMLNEIAESLGEDTISMVANFNCIKDNSIENKNIIGKTIYGSCDDDTTLIENALAWFAAEEVCRMFDE